MALHHRKLLFAEPEKIPDFDKRSSTDCYMCYVCPQNCYVPPPPLQLSQPDDNPERTHVSTVVILMLCILGVAFLVLSYLTVARYRFRSSRRRNPESLEDSRADENLGPVSDHHIWYIRTVGLPQSVINSIASFQYKEGDELIDGHDCSVCLNDFQEDERLRLLPKCSHAFHVGCIDTWLRSHMTCPVCRAPILVGNAARLSTAESGSSFSESNRGENEFETRPQAEADGPTEAESRGAMQVQEDRTAKISSKSRNQRLRVLSDLGDHRVKDDDQELKAVRRSVSMDFSSAWMIYQAAGEKKGDAGCSETMEKQNSDRKCRGVITKSCSYGQTLQKGPVSMKRSFSFNGKRSLRKNSRSQESIQIPEIRIENCGR